VLSKISKYDIFGEEFFFSGFKSSYGAKSINIVNIVYIEKDDFFKLLNEFPRDKEVFF
jgi:CRP-like cAMP-binding protein